MGRHFDGLVNIVNNHLTNKTGLPHMQNMKDVLYHMIKHQNPDFVLYQLPLDSRSPLLNANLEKKEFIVAFKEYIRMSEKSKYFFAVPMPVTGMEDLDSLVIFKPTQGNNGKVVISETGEINVNGSILPSTVVWVADVAIKDPFGFNEVRYDISPSFIGEFIKIGKDHELYRYKIPKCRYEQLEGEEKERFDDLCTHFKIHLTYCLKEIMFCMDRRNFNLQGAPANGRSSEKSNKNKKKVTTTQNRTIIIPSRPEDINETIKSLQSGDGNIQPDRRITAYWRFYGAECYTNMRGKWGFVSEHLPKRFDSKGRIYHVLVRDDGELTKIADLKSTPKTKTNDRVIYRGIT